MQSSIFGLSGFRPTQGELSGKGMCKVTGNFDSAAWVVQDPSLHPKIAEALKLPGLHFSSAKLHTACTIIERVDFCCLS